MNKQIFFILDTVRKYAEGPTRSIPFSITKVKIRAACLYQKTYLKQLVARKIDVQLMEKRRIEARIEIDKVTEADINLYFKKAQEKQSKIL